jgi:hypothetical protein
MKNEKEGVLTAVGREIESENGLFFFPKWKNDANGPQPATNGPDPATKGKRKRPLPGKRPFL